MNTVEFKGKIYSLDMNGFVSYNDAKEIVRALKFKSKRDYLANLPTPKILPSIPNRTYSNYWISWGDFLGTGKKYISKNSDNFPTYIELQNLVISLGIKTKDEYRIWVKGKLYPSNPNITYKHLWVSWRNFLGTDFPDYDKLKTVVRKNNIKTKEEYHIWVKDKNYPYNPDRFYKDKGWKNWKDFLGTNFLTYDELKTIVKSIGIKTNIEYSTWVKGKEEYPSHPEVYYKDKGWIDWYDFLEKDSTNSISSGESFLMNNLSNYEYQKKFDWLGLKSLDFFLPDLDVAIEVQGKQHFQSVDFFGGEDNFRIIIERDELKYNLCKEHGIIILYYVHDNSIKIPQEFLDKYEYLRSLSDLINKLKELKNRPKLI